MAIRLSVNKTKLMRLCKELGYNPPRNAKFDKLFREWSWRLEWEDNAFYSAHLFDCPGGLVLGVTVYAEDKEHWKAHELTIEQIKRLGIAEAIAPKVRAPEYEMDNEPEI